MPRSVKLLVFKTCYRHREVPSSLLFGYVGGGFQALKPWNGTSETCIPQRRMNKNQRNINANEERVGLWQGGCFSVHQTFPGVFITICQSLSSALFLGSMGHEFYFMRQESESLEQFIF